MSESFSKKGFVISDLYHQDNDAVLANIRAGKMYVNKLQRLFPHMVLIPYYQLISEDLGADMIARRRQELLGKCDTLFVCGNHLSVDLKELIVLSVCLHIDVVCFYMDMFWEVRRIISAAGIASPRAKLKLIKNAQTEILAQDSLEVGGYDD